MGRLAREGRFEFVQGGWVQADEANSHYFALLNQMLDGHEWLQRNLPDAKPRTGWAIDPFGLSPVMAQVNKMFGLDAMHIQVWTFRYTHAFTLNIILARDYGCSLFSREAVPIRSLVTH